MKILIEEYNDENNGDYMDLVNQKVKHITLGTGIVIDQVLGYVTVEFALKTSKFVYPDTFTKFLTAEDATVHASILNEIEVAKTALEEQKRNVEAVQKSVADYKTAEYKAKKVTKTQTSNKPHSTRSHRVSGKPMVFFVFQGNTFDKESRGNYIWAPVTNKAGSNVHHWNRLLDVRARDIILHGCDGCVAAISIARAECYECQQPEELRVEDLWDRDGRRVDCDYIVIQQPIKTANYKDYIINLSTAKYSPFNRDGNGNMGYLYEINRDLARFFVSESVSGNKYLLNYEVINDFLNEELGD